MIDKPDYIDTDGTEYRITEFLWSCPMMATWIRLALFWAYIPYLIYHFIRGTPVWIAGKKEPPHVVTSPDKSRCKRDEGRTEELCEP